MGPRIVQSDLALPTLYLHFLDKDFLPQENGAFDSGLRSGNDNSELQIILPLSFSDCGSHVLDNALQRSLETALAFVKSHAEVEISALKTKAGGFGPQGNFSAAADAGRLYFGLKTARPKAPISLDKKAFGIPDQA